MDKHITENAVDVVKTMTALAPPGATLFFGITLEEWMFIASIIASVFIVLDKLPGIVDKIYAKFKKQSSPGGPSSTPPESPG